MKEEEFEQLLKAALKEEMEEDLRDPSFSEEILPSRETDRKTKDAIRGKRTGRRRSLKVAVLLLCILGSFVFVKPIRANVFSYFIDIFSDYNSIHFSRNTSAKERKWEISYVPEGYRLVKHEMLGRGYEVYIYENQDKKELFFKAVTKDGEINAVQDNESVTCSKIEINGNEAFLALSHDPEDMSTLTIDTEETVFFIHGFLSKSELLRVGESIREKN